MNLLKYCIPVFLVWLSSCLVAAGQGCVAVRPMSCSSPGVAGGLIISNKNLWQASANYRYFKSHRHFRGDVEQKEREEDDTEVININHSVDVGILYGVSSRVSVSVNVPLIWYDRSSLYEHYGNSPATNPDHLRFSTSAQGIGDIRLTGYYYLVNPAKDSLKGNILAGLGVKFPTGDHGVIDEF